MKIIVFMENNQHGGLDTFCSTLLNAWPDPDDHFVFVCNESHPGQDVLRQSITRQCEFVLHATPLSWVLSKTLFGWLPGSLRRVTQPFLRVLLYPHQRRTLRRLLKGFDADALLVMNGGFPGGESCRIANIAWADFADQEQARRNIHNFHNYAVPPRLGFGWYENGLDRKLALAARRLISVSRSCAESLRVREAFRESVAIEHIYNGIAAVTEESEHAAVPDLRADLGIGDAPLCIILANYEERKGHRFLFEAFARVAEVMPQAHLVACGGGSEQEKQAVVDARREFAPSANIHLLGFVPGGPQLIDQVDVVTISSQSFESFGLTAVEGMRRGVPVVATAVGGLPEVLGSEGQGGVTVASDDPKAFGDQILRFLQDPELRQRVGEKGRVRAETLFTAERMAQDYHRVMSQGVERELNTVSAPRPGEWHYVLRRSLNPVMAWQAVKVVGSALIRRLSNRYLHSRVRHYPADIRRLAEAVSAQSQGQSPGQLKRPVSNLPSGPCRLKLATGYIEFSDWPDWATEFEDHEQFVSMHRWNWLLRALTDEPDPASREWGIELVRSWLRTMPVLPKGFAGESYTTGERISNVCLFGRHCSDDWQQLPSDILAAIAQMGTDLAARVEYHSGELSGNHVFNNARALLFVGHCCDVPALTNLGRALIAERLPSLMADGMFLREGSSHYQLLFTRWVLELRMLTDEVGDRETLALLDAYLPGLLEGCAFFQVSDGEGGFHFPCFGDISPDCEPDWLADLLASPLAGFRGQANPAGWAALFASYRPVKDLPASDSGQQTEAAAAWRAYPEAGWYRLDYQGWVALWHAENPSGPVIATHGHHDFAACVLYRHGREVLIEVGRLDYSPTPLGRYGMGAEAHNGVTLNGRPPVLSRGDRLLPEQHRHANCSVRYDADLMQVWFTHDGFGRVGAGEHERGFTFAAESLEIEDRFKGQGEYWMEVRFHQPGDDLGVLPGTHETLPVGFRSPVALEAVKAPEVVRHSVLVESQAPVGGWRFMSYGVKRPALTQRFLSHLTLPAVCRYRLVDQQD